MATSLASAPVTGIKALVGLTGGGARVGISADVLVGFGVLVATGLVGVLVGVLVGGT